MSFKFVMKKAEEAYEALIECVRSALEEDEIEFGVICGTGLVEMADAESGNYVGAPYFNIAADLGAEVVKKAKEEGVPSWLRPHVEEIEKKLKEWGYAV